MGSGTLSAVFGIAGMASDEKGWYVAAVVAGWTSAVAFVGAASDALGSSRQSARRSSADFSDSVVIGGSSSVRREGSVYNRKPETPPESARIPYTRDPAAREQGSPRTVLPHTRQLPQGPRRTIL